MSGKGSKPRPLSVSSEEFAKNFDRIFRSAPENLDQFELLDDAGDLNIEYISIDENTTKGVIERKE